MIKVAIIDDMLDEQYIKKSICVEHIKLCDSVSSSISYHTHATISALILSKLCENISILNIVILQDKFQKGNIDNLVKAIDICIAKEIDIISISLGSVLMTDSYKIEQIVKKALKKKIIIVAAANNDNIFTVPASLPGVIGVRREITNFLPVGGFFWNELDRMGIQCTVNCNFKDLGIDNYIPSNSYAVPVIVAEIVNNFHKNRDILLNRMMNKSYGTLYSDAFKERDFLYAWKEDVKVNNINILIMDEVLENDFFIELMMSLHKKKQYLYIGVYNKFRIDDIRYVNMSNWKDKNIADLYLFLANAYFIDYTITVLQPAIDGLHMIKRINAQAQIIIERNMISASVGNELLFKKVDLTLDNLVNIVMKVSKIMDEVISIH